MIHLIFTFIALSLLAAFFSCSSGMEGALVRDHRKVALRYDALDCDYYRMLNGDPDYVQNFKSEYMVDYSWAEPTAGLLFFGKK